MTKETKIGLLVGLAFIILFAIILSEKGAGPRPQGAPQFTRAEPAPRMAERGGTSFTDAGKLPFAVEAVRPESPRGAQVRPAAPSPVAVAPPGSDRRDELALPTLDPALIAGAESAASGRGGTPEAPADFVGPIRPEERTGRMEIASAVAGRSSNRGDGFALRTDALQARLDSLTARTGPAVETVPPTDPSDSVPTESAFGEASDVYTVQPGDTLTSIAKRVCGHCGPSAIDAICMANAGTIKDRNALVVGQKLIVPKAAGRIVTASGSAETAPNAGFSDRAKPKSDAGNRTAVARGRRDDAVASSARIYTVKPKDSLSRIAKEQLGDARRYREIVELNRNVLGKRDVLRPGMKLKLPPRGGPSAKPGGDAESSARVTGEATIAL